MRILKNRFLIISLCIAVVIAGVATTFSLMGYRGLARDIIGTVATPFRIGATFVTNAAEGFGKYFGSVKGLRERNEALQRENEELRSRLSQAEMIERENARLREYLDMKSEHPTFAFEEGTVIGREASNYVTVFTLNRGSVHGIGMNMPVVTESGVVGCVTDVGLTWCKVSTILETARSVGVYLPRANAAGILMGDYSLKNEGLCKLTFIDVDAKTADIRPGDEVYSNGIGSVYPTDLKVGTVVSVDIDNASRTLIATVRPCVDLSELTHMMILTDCRKDA